MSNTKLYYILILALSINRTCANYVFSANGIDKGHFIPLLKDKHGAEMRGEDSFSTSPHFLIVNDGVGGSPFSSKHISEFLSVQFQIEFQNQLHANPNFKFASDISCRKFTNALINKIVHEYYKTTKDFVTKWEQESSKTSAIAIRDFSVSTTMVAVMLETTNQRPQLSIIQKGDSLCVVFALVKNDKDRYFYKPVYMTKDQQYQFNFPYQVSSDRLSDENELFIEKVGTSAYSLVVLGSDGVFDNLHLGFLTMIVNLAAIIHESSISDEDLFNKLVDELVQLYIEILEKKIWVIRRFFKENTDTSLFSENNEGDNSNGGFIKAISAMFFGENKKMPKNAVNKFNSFMRPKIIDISDHGDKTYLYIKNGFYSYFSCPVVDMLSMPGDSNKENLLSPCIEEVLSNKFTFNIETAQKFIQSYSPKKTSKLIARVAEALSNEETNYPSPFYIHAWKQKVGRQSTGAGKPDDITVVANVIVSQKMMSIDDPDQFIRIFESQTADILKNMESDIIHFSEYFHTLAELKRESRNFNIIDESSEEEENKNPIRTSLKVEDVKDNLKKPISFEKAKDFIKLENEIKKLEVDESTVDSTLDKTSDEVVKQEIQQETSPINEEEVLVKKDFKVELPEQKKNRHRRSKSFVSNGLSTDLFQTKEQEIEITNEDLKPNLRKSFDDIILDSTKVETNDDDQNLDESFEDALNSSMEEYEQEEELQKKEKNESEKEHENKDAYIEEQREMFDDVLGDLKRMERRPSMIQELSSDDEEEKAHNLDLDTKLVSDEPVEHMNKEEIVANIDEERKESNLRKSFWEKKAENNSSGLNMENQKFLMNKDQKRQSDQIDQEEIKQKMLI